MPIHPVTRTALIPVIYTHLDGSTQTYWVSLKRFMEAREKGIPIQRIPRKKHKDIKVPEQEAPDWMVEAIENLMDFNITGLEMGKDMFELEIISELKIKKNGKLINTYPIKINKEKVAREALSKILG